MRELTVNFPLNRGFRWWVEAVNKGKKPWEDRAKKNLTWGIRIDSFGKFCPWVLKKGDK